MASQLSASLEASFRIQSLTFSADQFFRSSRPRQSLFSQFEMIRESQFDYLQTTARLSSHFKWTDDRMNRLWTYTLGPTLEMGRFSASENGASRSFETGALEGSVTGISHIYEFYDIHPEDGHTVSFNFDVRHPRFGFPEPLLKLNSTFAKLSRIGVWERGNLVAGFRANAATTFVPTGTSLASLPPSVKLYGGGSDDVRGFLLRTLPRNGGLGALTKLGGKVEIRRTQFLMDTLEIFAFLDPARFGVESWNLESRIWYSPGIGLRWRSPIGIVQTYAARARATHPVEDFGNFYFIGLGATF
jgi:translocation and assembly module TamA